VFEVKCQKIKNMHRPRLSIANPKKKKKKKKRKRKRKRKRKEKKKKKRVEGREMGARDFQRQP